MALKWIRLLLEASSDTYGFTIRQRLQNEIL